MSTVTNADIAAIDCPMCEATAGTPCFDFGKDAYHHSRRWAAEYAIAEKEEQS